MNVVFAGGGTAGHVFPALAAADLLREKHGAHVTFIGASDGQEAALVPAAGYPFVPVHVSSAQTRVSLKAVRALWQAFAASRRCRSVVAAADVAVGIGGYASAPAVLAARRVRTPLVLVEQNSVPGAVNRVAARWARVIATTFESTRDHLPRGVPVRRTGNPLRAEIRVVPQERAELRSEAGRVFDLEPGRTTVGVFGGSQGARHLDEAIAEALPAMSGRRDLQMLVATGPEHLGIVTSAIDEKAALLVRPFPFIQRMELALAATDVAVSRAGSGHLAELAACGIPAILVPYPHATENHQESNARELETLGAAEVVLDDDLSTDLLSARIQALVADDARRSAMAAAMRAWALPDADELLADLILETGGAVP
jgi:UDP-N-acetylglucosamine--N-acetylmuramyl-(pentapeptide) pyrophosphoryl-undecaprenol N-acetylglucosamine transferase